MRDLTLIIALTTGSCALVALFGLFAVRKLRSSALRVTVVIAALVPVLAVAVSVFVNVRAMFISTHDSFVVLVALGWAMVIAGGLAVAVGRSVNAGASAVRQSLQRLGGGGVGTGAAAGANGRPLRGRPSPDRWESVTAADPRQAPAELAALAGELDEIRRHLEDSRARERALEQSRRELVAFMSHDLRTPLAGLRALAEGVEDGVVDDVPAAMSRIRSTVNRLSLLVDDLFELSRVTGGDRRRPYRPVSLAEVAMDVITEACDHARARGIELRIHLPDPQDRLPVIGDADELIRAMTNLVANALRHTGPGGLVLVTGQRGPGGEITIAVADGCGGIPDADLAQVFDVGWRGTPARTPDDGGAGLGLAIVRGVVQAHEGSVLVENIDGGCRFEVALPTAP